jgi:hypothetical protein
MVKLDKKAIKNVECSKNLKNLINSLLRIDNNLSKIKE